MERTWYRMRSKLSIALLVIVMLLSSAGIAIAQADVEDAIGEEDQLLLERYWEIYQYVKNYHVSGPQGEDLVDSAINGMLHSLNDPYSYYMNEEEYQELLESINGRSLVGIGIVLGYSQNRFQIEDLISGGPAASSGLQVRDVLTHVNGEELAGLTSLQEVVDLIIGAEGTAVKITVDRWRNQQKTSFTFDMKRESLKLPMSEARMLDGSVGYLKLASFGTDAFHELERHLAELQAAGMEQLILDLRGNTGGFLDAAAEVAKLFQQSGVLLHMKDNTGKLQPYVFEGGKRFDTPMAVLVDSNTASAAEVLAGLLQDGEIGHLVGENTFGKGTIQELIELNSGGILRITVQEYFTPNKKAVHLQGIQPDTLMANGAFQLAKAYGIMTGKDELQVHKQGAVLPNGLDTPALHNETYKHGGKLYLSVRTLSEWFVGEVGWDAAAEAVTISLDGQKVTLKRDHSALKLVHSKSFIDVEQITDLLPLNVRLAGGTYVIQKR